MRASQFTSSHLQALVQLKESPPDEQIARRADILLQVAGGRPVSSVAREYRVSRQTLYSWIHRIQEWDGARSIQVQLTDRPREGRPAAKRNAITGAVRRLVQSSPQDFGYAASAWTPRLLHQHLRDREQVQVSAVTIRRCLQRLDLYPQEGGSTRL